MPSPPQWPDSVFPPILIHPGVFIHIPGEYIWDVKTASEIPTALIQGRFPQFIPQIVKMPPEGMAAV